jgi:hypothetical protein
MISMPGGHFVPIPFASLFDSEAGRARIRLVDTHSTRYAIAHRSRRSAREASHERDPQPGSVDHGTESTRPPAYASLG